jgi:hypothetical protein
VGKAKRAHEMHRELRVGTLRFANPTNMTFQAAID